MTKRKTLILVISTILTHALFARPSQTAIASSPPLGPLDGRNLHAPQLPWFSFAALKAASAPRGTVKFKSGIYLLNEFVGQYFPRSEYKLRNDGRLQSSDQEKFTLLDYGSTVWEIGIEWQALKRLRLIGDWRLHFRYGGFMDSIIEGWHTMFKAPNAGREFFDQNQSRWTITTNEGIEMSGSGNIVASGDLDIRLVSTLIDNPQFALALQGALKLPFGTFSSFGSGYPDIAVSAVVDWRPWTRWAFYAGGGLIIPTDGRARLMGQFIPAVEFRILEGLSLIAQMNIQTSPITGTTNFRHRAIGIVPRFSLPQTDIKIGFRGRAGRFDWQFYVEEDPFTWEGPDILFYFAAGWTISPAPRRHPSSAQTAR